MKTTNLLSVFILLFSSLWVKSQDQNYSQFFNNGLYYNPSYAGLYEGVRTYINYRSQWTNLPYDFKSYNVAADVAIRNFPGSGGIGIIVHNNNEGEGMIMNLIGGLVLSTRIPIQQSSAIQFGITSAVCQKKIDYDGLVFPDQLDGKLGNIYPTSFSDPTRSNVIYPDFNAGTIFNYTSGNTNARIGGALHHLFTPNIGFVNTETELKWKFVAHSDVIITWNQRSSNKTGNSRFESKLNPGFIFENQYGANSFSLGLNGYKSGLYLGMWYRNEDMNKSNISSLIVLAGVNFNIPDDSRIRIMYSYDYIMNTLTGTGGNHEISIMFEFNNGNMFGSTDQPKNNKNHYKTEPCATF